jgi:hypothetical protein
LREAPYDSQTQERFLDQGGDKREVAKIRRGLAGEPYLGHPHYKYGAENSEEEESAHNYLYQEKLPEMNLAKTELRHIFEPAVVPEAGQKLEVGSEIDDDGEPYYFVSVSTEPGVGLSHSFNTKTLRELKSNGFEVGDFDVFATQGGAVSMSVMITKRRP